MLPPGIAAPAPVAEPAVAERAAQPASRGIARVVAVQEKPAAPQERAEPARPAEQAKAEPARRGRHAAAPRATASTAKEEVAVPAARAGGMAPVIAFARSQLGDRYRMGATGPNVWDCSGLTQAAYRRVGIRLSHSSRAQAGRARTVSRSQARPGDLVVGPGHVGIYMGRGMMIDAGNSRVGVSYRRMYRGLHTERF